MSPEKQNEEIQALKKAVEQADALAELKSNFLATMSHEIRTPMQSIYGLLELISEEKPDEKIQTMVDIAQQSASGLLEILDDILDFAKMDADKMELDVFEVPVRLLVRGILEALSVKVHGIEVELVDDIEENVPFVIIGDPKRLRQIIMNLCGNAIKFTKQGTVTVHVSTKVQHIKTPKSGVALRFEVVDTGIGMSEDVCNKLFKSFTQADNTTQRKFGGTGLGLSIAKKLVELMGGQIGVFSEEGKGSTFWFEIPTEEVDVNETTVEMPNLEGISVLSVEDHPMGAKEIVNSLQSMGATVENCPTYKEGLELIERRPFDVAIIDQGLPDGVGLDLIKEMQVLRPNMGFIMYTVRDDAGLQHSLNALGVTYLTKPASRAGLGEAVKDCSSKSEHLSHDGPKRLLIAEDTESVRYVIQQQLENLGAEADFVENGKLALEALDTGKYGVLISDLHMPEIDGYALVSNIREQEKEKADGTHLPVIVMTADVQMAQKQIYLANGFDECLLKPVSLGKLRGLLIRWGLLDADKSEKKPEQPTAENAKPTETGCIDFKAYEQIMGSLDETAIDMIQAFLDMTEPLIAEIQKSNADHDIKNLTEHAHSLKGSARSACCTKLGDLAAELQDGCENDNYNPDLAEEIALEFKKIQDEIKTIDIEKVKAQL